MTRNYFALILLFFVCQSFAQTKDDWNTISNGKWMYDLKPSPFVSLYRMNYFIDDSGNKKSLEQILKQGNINIDELPYAQINFKSNLYLATKKTKNSEIRFFRILKEKSDFFIVCNQNLAICDCKSGTFLYLKSKNKLQRIQKPFSFSLKRNLISRIKDYGIHIPVDYENKNFCELLKEI